MRRRLLLIAVLALLVGQATLGYAAALFDCRQECREDGPLGCSSDDGCCSCCSHPRTIVPVRFVVWPDPSTWSDLDPSDRPVPVPAPREILHVPKPVL